MNFKSLYSKWRFYEGNEGYLRGKKGSKTVPNTYPRHSCWKRTTPRGISHSCRIQGRIPSGNPWITFETRPRIFHRNDTRINSVFKIPLLHECTRVGGTQTAIVGVDRKRIYPTKCVPLERTYTIRKEKKMVWCRCASITVSLTKWLSRTDTHSLGSMTCSIR